MNGYSFRIIRSKCSLKIYGAILGDGFIRFSKFKHMYITFIYDQPNTLNSFIAVNNIE